MKKVLRIFLWMIVGLIFLGTLAFLFFNSRKPAPVYDTVQATVDNIERTTILTGTIEPSDEIEIKPQISGIVAEVNVEPGDFVHEGDIIARIKVIADEATLSSAQNRVETARLSLEQTQREYERTAELYNKKFVSREEYEQSENKLSQARQELAAAQDALSIVRDGISTGNAQGSNTLVRATITGQILEVPVKVGSSVIQANTMNDGTTIAKIADMKRLIFKGKVDETEVGLLRTGMPAEIAIGALPEVRPQALIYYIAPKSTQEQGGSNTFEVKATMAVPDSVSLRAGYSANMDVKLLSVSNVLTLPESAVEFVGDSTFVYVLTGSEPEQQWERRAIRTGLSDGVRIEVKSGVDTTAHIRSQAAIF